MRVLSGREFIESRRSGVFEQQLSHKLSNRDPVRASPGTPVTVYYFVTLSNNLDLWMEDAFGSDTKHRQGELFDIENNTSLIERFHATLVVPGEVRLLVHLYSIGYSHPDDNLAVARCVKPCQGW